MTKKQKARYLANKAVRNGDLVPRPCEVCGVRLNVHAHHDDYDKPLEVRWLCARHHVRHHLGLAPTKTITTAKRYEGYNPPKTVIYVNKAPRGVLTPKRTKWPSWWVNSLNLTDEEKRKYPIHGVPKS
jgi:hypothetical protein